MDGFFGWVLRRRYVVVIAWVVLGVVGVLAAPVVSERLHSTMEVTSPGYTANQRLAREFGGGYANPAVVVLDLPAGTTVDSPGMPQRLAAVDEGLRAVRPYRPVSYAGTRDRSLVGTGGRSTVILIYPPAGEDEVGRQILDRATAGVRQAVPGAVSHVTGVEQLREGGPTSGTSVLTETVIAALAALVILVWVFGSVIAFVPLVTAIISILVMQLAVLGMTHVFSTLFGSAVQFIVVILGLGLSIDYALLIVTRWRDERSQGADNATAVSTACRHAGHSVMISGLTASVGLFALVIVPVPVIRGIGLAGLFIPSTAMLVSLTLLPALLRILGPRLDWPRRRPRSGASRGWSRWAGLVVRHRWVAAGVGLAVLGGLTAAAAQINVAQPTAVSLASSGPARDGLDRLRADGFPDGVLTTLAVVVPPGADAGVAAARLAAVSGVRGAFSLTDPSWRGSGGSQLVLVVPDGEIGTGTGQAPQLLAAVRRAAPAEDAVGGDRVLMADIADLMYRWFPLLLLLVTLVTLVLLTRALRSVVLPLKAVGLNVLSVGATYGVVVLLWQQGHGSRTLYDVTSTGAVDMFAPILLFGFLFGLSMDYEVFILTRMREVYDRTGDTRLAIVTGVAHTGRLVTSAAVILFCALVSLSAAPDLTVKIVATGLAAGVLLDATVVRSVLVPAMVAILGRATWWLPRWLARLLRLPEQPPVADDADADRLEPAAVGR